MAEPHPRDSGATDLGGAQGGVDAINVLADLERRWARHVPINNPGEHLLATALVKLR